MDITEKKLYASNAEDVDIRLNLIAVYRDVITECFTEDFASKREQSDQRQYNRQNDFYGLVHVARGACIVKTKTKTFPLQENDLLFVRRYESLQFENNVEGSLIFNLWFNLYKFDLPVNRVFFLPATEEEDQTVLRIISLLKEKNYISTALGNSLALTLLLEYCKNLGILESTSDKNKQLIEASLQYIDKHLSDETLSVSEVAAQFYICTKHFSNLFYRFMSISPKQYIIKARFEKAMYYLANTDKSVSKIAQELNFSSSAYFIHSFHRHFNITPMQYRTSCRQKTED